MSINASTRAARIALCESTPNTNSILAALGAARKRFKLRNATQPGSNKLGALEHLTKLAIAALAIESPDDVDPLSVNNLAMQYSAHDFKPQDLNLALLFVSKEWLAVTLTCLEQEIRRWSSGKAAYHEPSPLATYGPFANKAAQYAAWRIMTEDEDADADADDNYIQCLSFNLTTRPRDDYTDIQRICNVDLAHVQTLAGRHVEVRYAVPVAPRETPPVPARASLMRTSIQTSGAVLGALIGGVGYAFSGSGRALLAAETVAGATIPVYVACWTFALIAPVDFWLGPASGSRAAQLAAPAGHDEPEPELRWAEGIRVPVPPVLCVRLKNLPETQHDERRAAYVAFKAAVCRAVNAGARSLEDTV
jgi:hypothetical protein